ncbi:hydroxypyruvate isomerase family protein [Sinomicrobium oceani]|uniref:hydroxypyruvate isomerase family protein n=1 Tax=Sinomicrobium oceani TaxID=1150368 RepID=UPI000930C1B4|nr:TIM barrel protein [Sinomicrobium oceani]
MKRRTFVQNSIMATLGASVTTAGALGFTEENRIKKNSGKHKFNLKYAPHDGMFKHNAGGDIISQLEYMADQGFTAFEDNGMSGRPVNVQEAIAKTMQDLGMEMGVFVAHKIYWTEPNLTSGDQGKREEFLADIKKSVDVAKRVNAKWVTVVPGYKDFRKEPGYQTAHVVESLKQAAGILEPHGIVMVLEPLNYMNHPGLFLEKSAQAFEICKAVNSPSCKILYDIYHQQITEGNLIPNIEASWDEIAYFQVGDNPGRNEPTTGEINYKNVFKYIYDKGFQGVVGMEHGNSRPNGEGELAVIEAYKTVDDFL